MTTGGSDDDKSWKWDGSASKLDDFNKMIARYCRKILGGKYGMLFWQNALPDLDTILGPGDWTAYAEEIYEVIADVYPSKARALYPVDSGFWQRAWHVKWRHTEYQRIFDKVESSTTGMAALEVEALGMENVLMYTAPAYTCMYPVPAFS